MIKNSLTKGKRIKISGTVQKVVKRDEQLKLVILADIGLTVFADCLGDSDTVKRLKVRKGSSVALRGIVASFGTSAVCLSDCRLLV